MRSVVLSALSLLLLAGRAEARPTLSGTTGLVTVPTAMTLSEGELVGGFSWLGGTRGYLFRPGINRFYYAGLGLLPGLEVSLSMLQVIGWIDPEAPGVAYAMHRLSNIKFRLPLPEGWPLVALGAQDPLSVNGLVRGLRGQTDYGLTTWYGVVTGGWGPLTVSGGYGQSRDAIRGVFGGVACELPLGLELQAEHDSRELALGLSWQPWSWLHLYGARMLPDDWAWGGGLSYML